MKNNLILIVDDGEINRDILSALFKDDYDILEAENGEIAMRLIKENKDDLAMILLDISMPVKDGFDVLDFMRFNRYSDDIPVIMISATDSEADEIEGLKRGASDFITKPFNAKIVKQRVRNGIELFRYKRSLERIIAQQTNRLTGITQFIIDVLLTAMEQKNANARNIIQRISLYTELILNYIYEYSDEKYNLTEQKIELIAAASLLHDIGELALPDFSVKDNKSFISARDKEIFESHTDRGSAIIKSINNSENDEYINTALEICLNHHERWDGSGYPNQLVGDEIPISAQVVGIADTYDSLRRGSLTEHPYNGRDAVEIITRGGFGVFSPVLTESLKMLEDKLDDIYTQFSDN